jgi:hypothetical protein
MNNNIIYILFIYIPRKLFEKSFLELSKTFWPKPNQTKPIKFFEGGAGETFVQKSCPRI